MHGQHFHSLIKGKVAFRPKFGIMLYLFDRHTRVFQALDKFDPCKVFIRITTAVTGIAFWRDQIFMLIITQGLEIIAALGIIKWLDGDDKGNS